MTAYRSTKELCFYCKYSMIQNFVYLAIVLMYLESVPKYYFVTAGLVFLITVMVRGATRRQEKDRLTKAKSKPTSLLEWLINLIDVHCYKYIIV
jgi:protein-S-isoprenylcysteine O-methyltransferase Ste14